ncbi:unnamed protein product [Bursaphelenchus xylophilus]|uniref:(pine wood nematode) hypothetical protein n=1 Tax=Bursaphelenchus xylophilus TaxID=6326 RepID=A0A7I8WKU4_BURXY|nr:unnamed protein product [Bursaphelenchus xylophilus]CAG9106237.1 unnamed protein product [Bursaphelenchus xylophilus]
MAEIGKGGHIQSLHQVSAENIQGLCQALEKGVVLYRIRASSDLERWLRGLANSIKGHWGQVGGVSGLSKRVGPNFRASPREILPSNFLLLRNPADSRRPPPAMYTPHRHNTERREHRPVPRPQPRRNSVAFAESAAEHRTVQALSGRGLERVRNSVDMRRMSTGRGAFDAEIVYGGSTFSLPPRSAMADEMDMERRSAQVMLTISAHDLKDVDPDGGNDPYCVVSVSDAAMARQRHWEEIGRTEMLTNTLDPEWATKILLTYYFEEQQRLQFEIFDKQGAHKKRMGVASMLLHEVVGSRYNRKTKTLYEEGKAHGTITVTAEELSEGRQESVYFVVSASDLDRKDFLGKCDPFLKVFRYNEDRTLQLAYRTRYHEQTLNPKWKPFEVHINQLCYGDKDREFLIECYDWDNDGNHDLVGSCTTTVNRLLNKIDKTLPLINEKKAAKSKRYTDSGKLHFHKVYCWMDFTFLDFITGGTELDFSVAVDFTKSNLPMNEETSLHHYDKNRANQYEIAIAAVADICQHYNSSKIFKAYGFGAKIPPDTRVHYNFPLNLETNDCRCAGVDGLLNAYLIAQRRVELSGPTDFAPTIRFAARHAAALPEDGSKYSVLLIITDGVITDIEASKEEIVKASTLPLSIIVVGVGYDSFDEMKILDSDNHMLSANGKYAKRDIVQFVQLRKFLPPHRELSNEDLEEAKAKLAKEVLYEVPGQLTSYMKSKGIYPRSPKSPFDASVCTPNSPRGFGSNQSSLRGSRPGSHAGSPRSSRRRLPQEPVNEFGQMRIC